MKQQAGFTLIELVIVIVILGILGAVAAPRFINLQGDAYKANVNALKGSLQSAATLGNTKAILEGKDKDNKAEVAVDSSTKAGTDGEGDPTQVADTVSFVYGFPAASKDGIIKMLQDADSFGTDAEGKDIAYIIENIENEGPLKITPAGRSGKECYVSYEEAKENTAPVITTVTTGC